MKTTRSKTLKGIKAWLRQRNTAAQLALVDWSLAEWIEVDESGWLVAWGFSRPAQAA